MRRDSLSTFILLMTTELLSGCGLYVPDKGPLIKDHADRVKGELSAQALYEDKIITHVNCELSRGLVEATKSFGIKWPTSAKMGTAITLTITAEQQSGTSLGASFTQSFRNAIRIFPTEYGGNVTSPQSFSISAGVTGSANATRTETIQWTQSNSDLAKNYEKRKSDCSEFTKGVMADSDLKLSDFLYDKLQVAAQNNLNSSIAVPKKFVKDWGSDIDEIPLFNTFTGEVNFVAAYGGGVNPIWKLSALTSNTANNLLSVENTYTNDIIITIGQLSTDSFPYQLNNAGQAQHQARVGANAIATSIQSQGLSH